MNEVYAELMAGQDTRFKKKLQAAQQTWLEFRDAHVASISAYPDLQDSLRRLCGLLALRDLTRERLVYLRLFLERDGPCL
jgi:uncharacterized protein YecT (DUF1311 family)